MELPLLALPDAPRADERQTGVLTPAEWEANRLACLTTEERNRAAERTITSTDAAADMAKFLFGIAYSETCECNMEPEFVYDGKDLCVQFESEVHYNKFIMQVMVCTLRETRVPQDTITYQIRRELVGSHSGSGNTDESSTIAGERFGNGLAYAWIVAKEAGGMGLAGWLAGSLAMTAAAGGIVVGVCIILAVAVAWSVGVAVTLPQYAKWWRNVVDTDNRATKDVRTKFAELKDLSNSEEAEENRGAFHKFFVAHKKRVHKAMFKIEREGKSITKIRVGFVGKNRTYYDYYPNTKITVNVPGGPLEPQLPGGLDTIDEETENEVESEARATNAAALTAFLMTPSDVRI